MKSILFIFAAIAAAGVVEGTLTPGLSFGFGGFYNAPDNLTAAKEINWTVKTPASTYLADYLTLYCHPDNVYCVYFDDNGYSAGIQFCILLSNFTSYGLDWDTRGYKAWTTTDGDGNSQKYRCSAIYFTSEEKLQTSAEERLATRNSSMLLQDGYIWMTGINGIIDKIPTSATDINSDTPFIKQRCLPLMGLHHFYNFTSTLECTSEQLYPWFLLTDSGNIIGCGSLNFGTMTVGDGQQNWYEIPNKLALLIILAQGPDCAYDLDIVTSHIYMTSAPTGIGC